MYSRIVTNSSSKGLFVSQFADYRCLGAPVRYPYGTATFAYRVEGLGPFDEF
jgi:hypothetical protein